jgi:hypothetical protein
VCILRMLLSGLLLWALWQNLVLWLTHWRYCGHDLCILVSCGIWYDYFHWRRTVSYMSWKIYCCFVLQPRIFVLLRRCIFDSDDEVSFFRIVHFAKFI